ncbi:shikimate dehydrogenase, partial [Schumannella luteola]
MTISAPRIARPRTVLVGLIGEGVAPSLTPPMHELEGARHGIHYVYRTIDLAAGEGTAPTMERLLESARRLGFDGLNITHPVKQTVIPFLQGLARSAAAVGAVNTVVFEPDGAVGHNTDVTGFGAAYDEALSGAQRGRVVLLGAGGAGSAVASSLAARGVDDLVIVDVDVDRAGQLAAHHRARCVAPTELGVILAEADGLVNATPSGMIAHPGIPVDLGQLAPSAWVADIVYRPAETELLAAARAQGRLVMTGLGMAMHQAADAFEIFTGETADRRSMLDDLTRLVANEAGAD